MKSINLLNLLLIAATILLAAHLLPSLATKATYRSPKLQGTPEAQAGNLESSQSPPPSDYMVVAEQNVFHPERKIPPETKGEKEKPKPNSFYTAQCSRTACGLRTWRTGNLLRARPEEGIDNPL